MNAKYWITMFLYTILLGAIIGCIAGLISYIVGVLTGLLNDKQLRIIIPIWIIGGLIIGLSIFISDFWRRH